MKARVKNTTQAMYGKEQSTDGWSLGKMLNWYNVAIEPKKKKGWAVKYAKDLKLEQCEVLSELPDYAFSSVGTLCRLVMREQDLVDIDRVENTLKDLIKSAIVSQQAPKKSKPYKQSVAYMVALGDIDLSIDNYIAKGKALVTDAAALVGMSAAEKTDMAKYLTEFKDEMLTIKNKSADMDDYSFGAAKANKLIKYCDDLLLLLTVIKAPRKASVRKKKPTSAAKLVSKMKFLQSSEEYGLNSVDVTKIIGADRVLVFNAKTRKVGIYQSNSSDGLAVKGSTLTGFNDKFSTQKTARKPLDIIPNLMKGAQTPGKKLYDSIKAVEMPLTGRINKDTMILKVWK